MKSTQSRIIAIFACLLVILLAIFVAENLGVDNGSDVSSEVLSEGKSSETTEESIEKSEESSLEELSSDANSVDDSLEESDAQTSSGQTSTEESSADISSETSDETSAEGSDKLSKKEKPTYIEKQEGVKYIAFTFDDGPSMYTPELLDYLEQKGISATFFVVGNRLENETYGSYVARAVSLGCEIGSHSYTHEYMFNKCSDEIYFSELEKTDELIYKYAGYYPIIMRPPGGSITKERAADSEYNVIIWWVDSEDWVYKARSTDTEKDKNIQTIVNNIITRVHDTTSEPIVLMHDLYQNSLEAFKIASQQLIDEGYQFVTVAQLCDLNATTTVGKRYWCPTYKDD